MDTITFFKSSFTARFDAEFDDRQYDQSVLTIPIQLPVQTAGSKFRIEKKRGTTFEIFNMRYVTPDDVEVSLLYDLDDCLWMSDTPQERMMMYANAKQAKGKTLIGGLGLGIYPQYAQFGAAGNASSFVIVERDQDVIQLIKPILERTLKVPFVIVNETIEGFLDSTKEKFDEIFIDTWETLEPKTLPLVNHVKEKALLRLSWGGMIHLWGYKWISEMYNDACMRYLHVQKDERVKVLNTLGNIDERSARLLDDIERIYHGYAKIDEEKIRKEIQKMAHKVNWNS